MEQYPQHVDQIMPLTASQRRDLPEAVHELSALLTSERGGLERPYWSAPRLTSAYLRYFVPWNLLRLGRLLPGLHLPEPPEGALVLDLGSGPLTFPLALWIALPGWRTVPLQVLAVDSGGQALDYGRKLFRAAAPDSPWRISTLRAPVHKALRDLRGKPFFITMGNVLNELAEYRDRHGLPQNERMAGLARQLSGLTAPDGAILCVEPGNRLGGTVVEQFRVGALEAGQTALSPCPHDADCPLLDRRGPGSGWCHAVMDNMGAPDWLTRLAKEAGLGKTSLSLAHLYLRPAGSRTEAVAKQDGLPARILSDAFAVPGLGLARYACTRAGLVLIAGAGSLGHGSLITARPARPERRDPKTGISVLTAADQADPQP